MANASFRSYSQFRNAIVTCERCSWSGEGRQTKLGLIYHRGMVSEFRCPSVVERQTGISWLWSPGREREKAAGSRGPELMLPRAIHRGGGCQRSRPKATKVAHSESAAKRRA